MGDYLLKHSGEDIDALLDKVETATDIVASQIFLEFHSVFGDFQVFSHKSGYEEHNREVCQRLIENCFNDKIPNNEVFFVTINGLRDGIPYMETAILESQAWEYVRASFVKGSAAQSSLIAASIDTLSIGVEHLRSYVESGEDAFYWKYFSTRVPSVDAIGPEDESDVYVTEFTFEQITTTGTAVNVSLGLVNAIYNKRIIVIPGRSQNYIATNTFSAPPNSPIDIRMQIATGVSIYDVTLSAKGAAPQSVPTSVRMTRLLSGTLNTINGISLAKGTDMQLVSSISINSKAYTPSNGVVDLGNIEGAGDIPIYIADFTMESLIAGMNNGAQVDCDMQALVAAMNANKVILVRESAGSSYKGGYVLNGYAEDLLYFSIVDTFGNILWCEGTDYTTYSQYIDGRTLYLQHWGEKQDALVSGKNIKTINGESIVGGGDITVATMSEVNTAIANAITNAINASY